MRSDKKEVVLDTVEQNESLYSKWGGGFPTEIHAEYRSYRFRKWIFIIVCLAVAFLSVGIAVTVGDYSIDYDEVYRIIFNHILHGAPPMSEPFAYLKDHIIIDDRMPRIAYALVGGAGLAIAGAVMQSTLKNPMADPYTAGISSGAAFGASLVITGLIPMVAGSETFVVFAFVFALVPTGVIILISSVKKVSPTSMILAGLAVMYIFNAMTTVIKLMANPDDLASLYRWQVGSLEGLMWREFDIMFPVVVICSAVVMLLSNKINVLSAGDDSAKALGINAQRLRVICLVTISLMTAAVVSFSGVIGFVGLVAPHVVRIFIGSDNKFLIPASAAFGAALLIIADIVGRIVLEHGALQVGVVTAFLGGPLFLYLILTQKKEVW